MKVERSIFFLMRIILLSFLLFSLNLYSQNYSFKFKGDIESVSFDEKIKLLNKEILHTYSNKDNIKFYDNIFRLHILDEDYENGLYYLKKIRDYPTYKKLKYNEVIGLSFELYALSMLASEKNFDEEKYNRRSEMQK